jgi:hypothetical protein
MTDFICIDCGTDISMVGDYIVQEATTESSMKFWCWPCWQSQNRDEQGFVSYIFESEEID